MIIIVCRNIISIPHLVKFSDLIFDNPFTPCLAGSFKVLIIKFHRATHIQFVAQNKSLRMLLKSFLISKCNRT